MGSLIEKVRYRKYLFPAWAKVLESGTRSPSSATRSAIADFRSDATRNLERIQEELQSGRFQFSPGRGVPIPREGKDPRPIVIQDVRDRVVQRSLLDVLMSVPAVVTEIDHGLSFGGIPGKGVPDAFRPVAARISDGSAKYYIRSDIQNFFGLMPREAALARLTAMLPDRSLDEFLDIATLTELSNHAALGHLLDFFPDHFTGVPQGHALSALLGNILLRGLDRDLNGQGVLGVRYLDDFLVLGPDKTTTWEVFRKAEARLRGMGLTCYTPGKSAKAKEGSAQRMFQFLGCEISRGFVRPSRANRSKVLDEIRSRLRRSSGAMTAGQFDEVSSYSNSVATTLSSISRTLRGWSEQYSFCNYEQLQAQMDREIDKLLRNYLGVYGDQKDRVSEEHRRRMVGVWIVQDARHAPLLGE